MAKETKSFKKIRTEQRKEVHIILAFYKNFEGFYFGVQDFHFLQKDMEDESLQDQYENICILIDNIDVKEYPRRRYFPNNGNIISEELIISLCQTISLTWICIITDQSLRGVSVTRRYFDYGIFSWEIKELSLCAK